VPLWLAAIAAAAAIGFHAGESHARRDHGTDTTAGTAAVAVANDRARTAAEPTSDSRLPTPASATAESLSRDDDWQTIRSQPDTSDRDRKLAQRIEQLARSDPQRALALVAEEKNWRLRDLLRDAAVKGWAAAAPQAATDWVLALKPSERHNAVAALLDGASEHPEKVPQVTGHLVQADPHSSSEYAHLAIDSLGRGGAFQTAVELASQLASSDPSLLSTACQQWGERNPDAALASLQNVTDPVLRRSALDGLFNGWATAHPQALARRAADFSGDERALALSAALTHWAERDPVAATAWIGANDPGAEADDGIAAVSQQSSLADSNPETALHWAALIVDPARRTTAQQSVLARWAARAPAAARQYAESLPNPGERAAALAILPP
jgi:hypothetical protein